MAIYHLNVNTGSRQGGQSASAKADYIQREGKYDRGDNEVAHAESGHMPEWAADKPNDYWQAADAGERANGRLFREVEFALPIELDEGQQVELAREFAQEITKDEKLPYTLAIHRGEARDPSKPDNPHCHLMISERANDGIERSAETWFKRYNAAAPEKGGARKSTATKPKEWLENIREAWGERANQALEREGHDERIHEGTLEQQYWDAVEEGNEQEAARLENREPGVHLGPVVHMEERGIATERGDLHAEIAERNQQAAELRQEYEPKFAEIQRQVDALTRNGRDDEQKVRDAITSLAEQHYSQTKTKFRKLVSHEGPSGKLPADRRAEPTPWERYQKRWGAEAAADREQFEAISKMSERAKERWRDQWRERTMRIVSTAAEPGEPNNWGHTRPLPLPRELAPEGEAQYGAARSEGDYFNALPLRYRKRWIEEGLFRRVGEVAEKARTSLRGRLSRNPKKYVEDTVRRECGPQAQRLDQEMREDMRQKPPHHLAVLNRMDTMQHEEWDAAQERARAQERGAEWERIQSAMEQGRKRLQQRKRGRDIDLSR